MNELPSREAIWFERLSRARKDAHSRMTVDACARELLARDVDLNLQMVSVMGKQREEGRDHEIASGPFGGCYVPDLDDEMLALWDKTGETWGIGPRPR